MHQLPLPWVFLFQSWHHFTDEFSILILVSWRYFYIFLYNSWLWCQITLMLAHITPCHDQIMWWSLLSCLEWGAKKGPSNTNITWTIMSVCFSSCWKDVCFITNHPENMLHPHCFRFKYFHSMVNILPNMHIRHHMAWPAVRDIGQLWVLKIQYNFCIFSFLGRMHALDLVIMELNCTLLIISRQPNTRVPFCK